MRVGRIVLNDPGEPGSRAIFTTAVEGQVAVRDVIL
jgi:hypothetical protein